MPLFEYQCRKCGARVEKIQKFTAPSLAKCEKCGGTIERLLSSPAIQFKGSGWYITDYARKSSATSSEASLAPKAEKTTENAKPAEPAPAKPAADTK